jgi:MYXO-CTERM domain-containing protein
MRSLVHLIGAAVAGAILALAAPARAQTFPSTFSPLYCGRGLMTDGYRDQSGAVDERDIVGTPAAPAGFRAVDAQFLYLRLRLDVSPAQGNGLRPFAWGFELSTDGDPTTYEILIAVDGAAGTVSLYRNTTTTMPNSPADPADQPPVMTFPFAQYGRVLDAGRSLFGGGNDSFLDMAVPWSDLTPLGLTASTVVTIWAASSTGPDRLDGDFACHDGAGGSALPGLSGSASAPIAADPGRSPGPVGSTGAAPDGGGNLLAGSGIEGGPGCSCRVGGGERSSPGMLLVGAGLWLALRRRRATSERSAV